MVEGINTAKNIAKLYFLTYTAIYSAPFIKKPPNKKV